MPAKRDGVSPVAATSAGDVGRALGLAIIAAVPVAGGPIVELLGLIPTSFDRRSRLFLAEVDERLRRIEHVVLDGEAFQTQFVAAWRAALGTHIESKIQLLAGAVASCADPGRTDHFMAMRWISMVDQLEPEHFAMLQALDRGHAEKGNQVVWSDVLELVGDALPRDLFLLVLVDLQERALVQTTGFNPANGIDDYVGSLIWLEPAGRELLSFVQLMAVDPDLEVDAEPA